jgi:hypothetical protein
MCDGEFSLEQSSIQHRGTQDGASVAIACDSCRNCRCDELEPFVLGQNSGYSEAAMFVV